MQDFTEDISKYVRARTGRDIGSDFDPSFPYKLKNGARVIARTNGQTIVEINGEYLTL